MHKIEAGSSSEQPTPNPFSRLRGREKLLRGVMIAVGGVTLLGATVLFSGATSSYATSEFSFLSRAETLLNAPSPTPLPDVIDINPSQHPSGKDRNPEPGNSYPQGKSNSNPDGNGVDKPYPVDGRPPQSQGSGDFDGNNGCGNDNDFSDDNNGNCGGKGKDHKTPTASVTPSITTTPVPSGTPQFITSPSVTPTAGSQLPEKDAPATPHRIETPSILPKAGEIDYSKPIWGTALASLFLGLGLRRRTNQQ